jgi:ribonuclease E
VRTRAEIALYLLNHKRAHLRALEERFRITIMVNADAAIGGQLSFVIEKGEQVHSPEQAKALRAGARRSAGGPEDERTTNVEEASRPRGEAAASPRRAEASVPRATCRRANARPKRRRRRRGRHRGASRDGGAFQPERDGAFAHDRTGTSRVRTAHSERSIEHQDAAARGERPYRGGGRERSGPAEAPGEARGDSERRRRRADAAADGAIVATARAGAVCVRPRRASEPS